MGIATCTWFQWHAESETKLVTCKRQTQAARSLNTDTAQASLLTATLAEMATTRQRLVLLLLAVAQGSQAFYLPGAAPHDYSRDEKVDIYVNALTPMLAGNNDAKLVRGIHTKTSSSTKQTVP